MTQNEQGTERGESKEKEKKRCVGLRDQRGEKWDSALGWDPGDLGNKTSVKHRDLKL